MEAPPVQYVRTSDGFNIAYAVSGGGPNLVFMPWPASHIQLHWTQTTYVRPWLRGLAAQFRLIQYDSRGQGMSSRGLPPDFELLDYRRDLEAVVEQTGLEDFVLMAADGIGHVAVSYAIAHPQRVRALILASPVVEGKVWEALWGNLPEQDWEAFLRNTALLARPSDFEETIGRIRQAVSQGDWLAWIRALVKSSMESDLPRLSTPTLVIHPRDYETSLEEIARVASSMPHGQLVTIDGASLLGDAAQGLQAIDSFLAALPVTEKSPIPLANFANLDLSLREAEVLRLLAAGKSNQQIADDLVISLNTVRRHVSNIFDKTGVANRAQAAVYARDHGLT